MSQLEISLPKVLKPFRGKVGAAVVLGSGLGGLAAAVADATHVPYADIEGYPAPASGVAGQAGRLTIGDLDGKTIALFEGRVHAYQGVSALDAAWTARVAAAMGCGAIVLTNAAGGVAEHLRVGDIVLVEDHMNLTGDSPLLGWPGAKGGTPFVGMADAYDSDLRRIAMEVAAETSLVLHPGVYACVLGPSYETPAEVRALRMLGADVVGMSTVPEVIAARALGMRVLAFSLVTNASGSAEVTHADVLAEGDRAGDVLAELLSGILGRE